MSETLLKAGQLLCIDEGQYSDYSVIGFFVVLQEFEPFDQLEKFAPCPDDEPRRSQSFSQDGFLAFLLKNGFLLEIDYRTLYLGTWGRVSQVHVR